LVVAPPSTLALVGENVETQVHFLEPPFLDAVAVGDEVWVARPQTLTRYDRSGSIIANEPISLDMSGRFLIFATAPDQPIWHCAEPVVVRADPVRSEIPGPGGQMVVPLGLGQFLLWRDGVLQRWRPEGVMWRAACGRPDSNVAALADAQIVHDGSLFVLVQTSGPADSAELLITAVRIADGSPHLALRVSEVGGLAFAAHRGLAVARMRDRFRVIDLRLGRWIRDLELPAGTEQFAVDDLLQWLAYSVGEQIEIVRPEALALGIDREALGITDSAQDNINASAGDVAVADEPLPTTPLVRLLPHAESPSATAAETTQFTDLRLAQVGARVALAIAHAWNSGRIARPDPFRPPFADEVDGLLGVGPTDRAADDVSRAMSRLNAIEDMLASAERSRMQRRTPLDVLARDFELSHTAVEVLVAILAPRLEGHLARLYAILANDPTRAMVDEHLLGQILGTALKRDVTRELDVDRPLRRYGLVQVGSGVRPFAALTVDPVVVRFIADLPPEGEPEPYLTVRTVERDLEELELPRTILEKALRYASDTNGDGPARIVVRGRTGFGRHTLLCSLAARAGRALGIIDLAGVPRGPGLLASALDVALRRALLRGLLPCIDGIEQVPEEDPQTKLQLASVIRSYPGPLGVRLPAEAPVPLDPGYLLLDLPQRSERQRIESWSIALERHGIPLHDAHALASRYRVGPGTIHAVCASVARHPDRPTEPAALLAELEQALRQRLESRIGATATRVSRLATWSDIVLPQDIIDSLLELTSRVRHRRLVYEQWGFDRALTTARGITALFQGGPGTGKTMVAGVIARELGLELFRVDVSRITSKWLGETEKNLSSLFDAAEEGQVMLLFDEADSLFAKRTEVKTSVDRYANMEVNYLLQRLDSFEGIAILTTNFGTSIDPAFKRRLTYRVTFPFPDEDMREQLWRTVIPPLVPIEGQLEFSRLAQRFRMSGGYIRNAALRAAFLAAEEGRALSQDHLERAVRMEFREIGKLAETGTLE
jgi:hypothetical protein